ncbi:MAG TPA: cyclic nucleotide-binding domain-containing protein [Vicinamibacteria bacterium]|nr:cyclic nucleotide-binding domain-containing protein [Vicinamibacteria bacterium]
MLQWFGGEATVPELIRRQSYGRAEQLLRKRFEAGQRDLELRMQLADVIALDGRGEEAAPIYIGLADELARAGHAARAIAVLKKIEQVAPGRDDVARRLASLIGDHGTGAAEAPAPVPDREAGGPPPAGIDPALSSPLFGDFSRDDLLAVFQGLRFRAFQPGDIVVGDGEPADSLFVISSGRVKAFVKGPEGRYHPAREMGEGDFFGEIAILHGRPRTATVTAAAACELLELDRATVETLAATRPRVREVLRSFCEARAGA